jgi:ubiquinone/menaquinone biosynthesis C-methylase UbiE
MMGTIQGLVLDAACGPGTFGRSIAAQSQAVFGIDISHGMLEQGRQYAQREHVSNIHFARARVEALPFPDDTFAAALCCGSLHLFEDPLLTLRQIGRTLKCGAQLVAVTFAARDTAFSRFAQRHGARLFEVDGLGNLLLLAGFEDYRPRLFGSALIFSARKTRRI